MPEKRTRTAKIKLEKVVKPKKAPKPFRTLEMAAEERLASFDLEKNKKPWMASKAIRLVDTAEALVEWRDRVIADTSAYRIVNGKPTVVLAIDTETTGLDTRIFWSKNRFRVNVEIAGLCLSHDGVEGLYVPINHVSGRNIDRRTVRDILKPLFDISHQVYFNAKFDKEILRICLGVTPRDYPYFEDVQVLQFINDPKAKLEEEDTYTGGSEGLKDLSRELLEMEQIDIDDVCKVKIDVMTGNRKSSRSVMFPFTWVPPEMAVWYAAPDAICTWLLWQQQREEANTRKAVHKIDHDLVDSITWMERQRSTIDEDRWSRTVAWHQSLLKTMRTRLRTLALEAGFVEEANEDGEVLEDNKFKPSSTHHMSKLLFEVKGYEPTKLSAKTGAPSCDKTVISDLIEKHPDDEFLKLYKKHQQYVSLHPENLHFDREDNSARIYLKANVVAGGRLSGGGGKDYEVDGGMGLNPQAVKKNKGNWWVRGNVLVPDKVDPETVTSYEEKDLHPSCFKKGKKCKVINNHIGQYHGYAVCLVPSCKECESKYGILIENGRLDANEVVNLRALFVAPKGWTYATCDYSNVEMRVPANLSGEPAFINEFLQGTGDFHSLTASAVFPEFNDPKVDAATKSSYRDLAKIINFALLYGGTYKTIYNNMKKKDPTITEERAKKMVADYWKGVPVFHKYCQALQQVAREQMICRTATGRVVKFESARKAEGIDIPSEKDWDVYWDYRKLVKKSKQAYASKDNETGSRLEKMASAMYRDPKTRVSNTIAYQSFMSKIQRVAVNVPMQGVAADFMRMAINRIRKWVTELEPAVQSVFRLYISVHDELDFAIKNEYVPFVMPRITRLMKLRRLFAIKKWPVPLECDCEYGTSWDIEHHLTGSKDDTPTGYMKIPGLDKYIPDLIDESTLSRLLSSLTSESKQKAEKAEKWLRDNMHPRTAVAIDYVVSKPSMESLIMLAQLHEFWTVDGVDDDETMETLEEYEARMGLTEIDRGEVPPGGFRSALDLDWEIERPPVKAFAAAVGSGVELSPPVPPTTSVCAAPTPVVSQPEVREFEIPSHYTQQQLLDLRNSLGNGPIPLVLSFKGEKITMKVEKLP